MENKKTIKILNFIFLLTFLVLNISFTSAADWDNIYNYDEETKTATIENWFGAGADLAYITLTTSKNVVSARGDGMFVGGFNYTPTGDFTEVFNDIFLTDMKNGNSISRGKQFKYKKYTEVSVDDYETICEDVITGNGTIQECTQIEIGSHLKTQMDWIPINNPTNIFYEGVTYEIGVFVDVEAGDWGDWVPSIMGVEIEEWSTWTESLNVGLVSFYKLNETSGVVLDSLNINNGTNNGATQGVPGIINNSYDFIESEGDFVNLGNDVSLNNTEASFSAWINITSNPAAENFILGKWSANQYGLGTKSDNTAQAIFVTAAGENRAISNITLASGQWIHIVSTWDSTTGASLYINGSLVGTNNDNSGSLQSSSGSTYIGSLIGAVAEFDGRIDEVAIFNRTIDISEVIQLYNNGTAITWTDAFAPTITILFPQNITYNETVTQLNYTNSSNAVQCWFSKDGGLTNSTPITCGTNFTTSSVGGLNTWIVYGNSSEGAVGNDSITFFVNKTVLTTLISPADASNTTNQEVNFSFTSTPINTNLTNATLSLWNDTDGALLLTNFTTLSGTSPITTNFTNTLEEGNYKWNVESCSNDAGCSSATTNNSFIVHLTSPSVTIHYPNETIIYVSPGGNLTLNWTISEPGRNLSEHIVNCSYIYNGVETPLNLSQCIITNQTSFLYVDGINNLTFKVTDQFGLITTNITSWNFLFEKYNVTFNNQTYEGTQETFTAEIILGDSTSISQAIFYYNDTNYTTNIVFVGGEYTIISSISIPLITQDTNFSLGFFIVIGGITYDLETFTQEALSINLSLCGPSNDTLLNMSLFDEETKVSILGNIEINAQAISKTSEEITATVNTSFTNISSARICLSPTAAYSNLYFSTEIRYSSTNYVPEFYYIQMADMADYPRNLSLFDLAANDSTEFLIKYQDDSLIPVEGAIIQLQRRYISESIYEVVEAPLTSNAGTAVVHIDLNTNKYRASVVKDGVLLDFFDNIVFDCENELSGECTELLLGLIDPQNDVPITNLTDFSYTISSINNTITTSFIIPSGTPSSVNVLLIQTDQFGNETTCNQSVISSAGTIECSFNNTIGDSYLALEVSKDEVLQAQQSFIVVEDTTLDFLGNNFFIVIIIMLSLIGMAVSSPEWMIINGVVVMLIGGAFWLLQGMNFVMGLGSLMWLVISAIILIIKLSKQEDR